MNIAFYAPLKSPDNPTPSGDREIARNLMAAFEHAGHHVELASQFRTLETAGDKNAQRKLRHEAENEAERLLAAYHTQELRRPEIWVTYHIYHKAPDWIGPVITRNLGIPYVVVEASISPRQEDGKWSIGHRAACAAVAHADAIIGLNPRDAECVRSKMSTHATYRTMQPFLTVAPYVSAANRHKDLRRTFAAQHNIESDKVWLLTVGMMRTGDKYKSYEQLALTLDALHSEPWHLLCVGDGPEHSRVRSLLGKQADRVTWLGRKDTHQLPPIYAACDVFVWPAVNEALGMVFLEAGASGLPSVAGHTDGVASIVQHEQTGLVAPAVDHETFAAHLKSLIRDDTMRNKLGRAATSHITASHSLASAAKTLDQCLVTALNRRTE